ncbi:MAG: hypothetical protein PQJ60_10645, partial [Spirochaetales bacterium]|nr:hypothetical protein [Spirochaetales bacterium]
MSSGRFFPLALFLLTLLGALLLGFLLTPRESSFYSLLLMEGETASAVDFLEGKKGVDRVYSADLPVVYSDFGELRQIPLSRLSARLLKEDRRWDPFLIKLSDLYMTERGGRVFFESDRSLFSLLFMLAPLKGRIIWEQVDHPFSLLVPPLLFAVLALVFLFRYRSASLWPLLIQIIWFPLLFSGEPGVRLFIPLLVYWEVALLRRWRNRREMAPFGAALLVMAVVLAGQGRFFFLFAELILSLGAGFLFRKKFYPAQDFKRPLPARRRSLFPKKTEHPLFEPSYFAPLSPAPSRNSGEAVKELSWPVLLFMLPLLLPLSGGEESSWEIPGIDEYYQHYFYQENILHAPVWGSEESLVKETFSWDKVTGEIQEHEEVVAEFSPSWKENVNKLYFKGFADSLVPMLSEGGKTLALNYKTEFDKYTIFAIIVLFFISKLVVPLWNRSGREKKSLQIIKRGREV